MKIKNFENKLELTNSGSLSLFFLGTGSAFSKKFLQTNLLVIKGNDHLLIDCGAICPFIMERLYHTNISEIKNFVITHPHSDHIGGLEEVGFVTHYVNKTKANIIINDEFKNKLWNESLAGGMQYSENGKMTFDDYFNQIKPVLAVKKPYEILQTHIGSIDVKLFRTRHVTASPNSFKNSQYSQGVIIDNRILYPCDSQFNPEQLKFICQTFPIEYIFHDCDLSGYSSGVHASYEQLKTLPVEMKEKMFLCHYGDSAAQTNPKADGFAGFAKGAIYYIF